MAADKKTIQARKLCFVICPIGDDGSEVRNRSNRVLKHIIIPAARECGFRDEDIERADLLQLPGIITSQIVERLEEAELVIADLTDHNPNVFYELAIRHFTRKPVVLMIQRGQRIPFDVSPNRVIHYDLHDWESPSECEAALMNQIKNTTSDGLLDNPVSAAITSKYLRQQDPSIGKVLSELVESMRGLSARIGGVEEAVRASASRTPGLWGSGLPIQPPSEMFSSSVDDLFGESGRHRSKYPWLPPDDSKGEQQ